MSTAGTGNPDFSTVRRRASERHKETNHAVLPWKARTFVSPVFPPSLPLFLVVLVFGVMFLEKLGGWNCLPDRVTIPTLNPVSESAINWVIACGTAAVAVAASAASLTVVMWIGSYRRTAWRLHRIDWFRGQPPHLRRWLGGVMRLAGAVRRQPSARSWPGPGIVSTGLQGLDLYTPSVLPAEGDWLKRTGFMTVLRDGDTLASPIFLFFAVFPIMLASMSRSNVPEWKPITIIMIIISVPFAVRWLVGIGALFRGMFDAHIDTGSIEFAGPWRTDVFERDKTVVFLIAAGPLVDTTLVHRSGRRARLLLSKRGARKLLTVWTE